MAEDWFMREEDPTQGESNKRHEINGEGNSCHPPNHSGPPWGQPGAGLALESVYPGSERWQERFPKVTPDLT